MRQNGEHGWRRAATGWVAMRTLRFCLGSSSHCSLSIMQPIAVCARHGARGLPQSRTGEIFPPRRLRPSRSSTSRACRRRNGRQFSTPVVRRRTSQAGISTMPAHWRSMRHPCCGGSTRISNGRWQMANWRFSLRPLRRRRTPRWCTCSKRFDAMLGGLDRPLSEESPRMAPGLLNWKRRSSSSERQTMRGSPC